MPNSLTIHQLIERLNSGEVTSRQATQACLDRIQSVDPELNAFISFDAADALSKAEAADQARADGKKGLLLGVPVAIKDVIAVKGHSLNCASKILGDFICPYDATVIRKLREAGAVVLWAR